MLAMQNKQPERGMEEEEEEEEEEERSEVVMYDVDTRRHDNNGKDDEVDLG